MTIRVFLILVFRTDHLPDGGIMEASTVQMTGINENLAIQFFSLGLVSDTFTNLIRS